MRLLFSIILIINLLCVIESQTSSEIKNDPEIVNNQQTNTSSTPSTKKKSGSHMSIFPGTKWCGKGNIAKDENDRGSYKADECCYAHDRCPVKIKGKTTNYGIHNNKSTSILSCKCDREFYDCLKGVHTTSSKTIGILYFDIFKNDCLEEYPEGSGQYIIQSNTTRYSQNRFVKLLSKLRS
ncbi:hypothetical protein HCN44_002281 [Aphidius gifuensis]|uniref:phospholipase A2 n=1 Tax=Aphidius gifuensis TaxID=684658 RepID=A0A835CXJ0_APHGI|nr:phospholipase A2-like [Aphidius gifuensis]KAF7996635.1 hypothetical protein HCN44_002281 [Aphidius gifuensis]